MLLDRTQQRCCTIFLTNPSMVIGKRWGSVIGGQRDQWQRFACNKFEALLKSKRAELNRSTLSAPLRTALRTRHAPPHPPAKTAQPPMQHHYHQHFLRHVSPRATPDDDDDPKGGHNNQDREKAKQGNAPSAESALRRAVAAAGGPQAFMAQYQTHTHNGVRGWLPWGPTNDAPALTSADLRCPTLLHQKCGALRAAPACEKCSEGLIGKGWMRRTDCKVSQVCALLAHAASARKERLNQRFVDAQLRPPLTHGASGGASAMPASFQVAVGGCLLTEAEHLLDIFRAMAECPHFFPWQGTQCYAQDARDFSRRLRSCCLVGDGSMGDVATQLKGAIMCRRLTRPVLATVQRKLSTHYGACVEDVSKCLPLHRDYYRCRLGDDARCMVALTGHDDGVNFLQVFKQIQFVSRMMFAAHSEALSPRAKQLLALCGGSTETSNCGREVSDLFFEGKDTRLGDPRFD